MPNAQIQMFKSQTQAILSHPSWDIILIFVLVAGSLFYGIAAGKQRIALAILHAYVAYAIAIALPIDHFISAVNFGKLFFAKSAVFAALFFVLLFTLGPKRRRKMFAFPGSVGQVFILSFLAVGLLMHLILQFLPREVIPSLSLLTRSIFANPDLHIWWVLLPVVVLIILKRFDWRDEY